MKHFRLIDFIFAVVVISIVGGLLTFTVVLDQYRQVDMQDIRESLANVKPADVLGEVKQAREEFRSSRFTHADGVRHLIEDHGMDPETVERLLNSDFEKTNEEK